MHVVHDSFIKTLMVYIVSLSSHHIPYLSFFLNQ